MLGERIVAAAAMGAFASMRQSGRERFGDRIAWLRDKLLEPLGRVSLASVRENGGGPEEAQRAAAAVQVQAAEAARGIIDTTGEWIEQGRDPWGADRAATVGLAESSRAYHEAQQICVAARHGRLRWVNGPKPCETCRKFHGRVVRPGSRFGIANGVPVYGPPDPHPNCTCRLEEVR